MKKFNLTEDDKKHIIEIRDKTGCSLQFIMNEYKKFLDKISDDNESLDNKNHISNLKYIIPANIFAKFAESNEVNQVSLKVFYDHFMNSVIQEHNNIIKKLSEKAQKSYKLFRFMQDDVHIKIVEVSVESDFLLSTDDFQSLFNEISQSLLGNNRTDVLSDVLLNKINVMMAKASEFIGLNVYNIPKSKYETFILNNIKCVKAFEYYPSLLIIEHDNGNEESLKTVGSKINSSKLYKMEDLEKLKTNPFITTKIDESRIVTFKLFA